MRFRANVFISSVMGVGVGLVCLSLANIVLTPAPSLITFVQHLLPVIIGVGLTGFGFSYHRTNSSTLTVTSLLSGAVPFGLLVGWILAIVRISPLPSRLSYLVLHGMSIVAVGYAVSIVLYSRIKRQQSELRLLMRNFQMQYEQLQAQNERLDEFAGMVSHDLQNPLNIAQGRVELAQETGDVDHLGAATRALNRIETIITDMLSLARQGQTVEGTEPVSVKEVAESAWGTVEMGNVTLRIEDDARVEADRSRLQQLFENLFRNAREHGGDELTMIRIGILDQQDGIYIEDDGVGIPPGEREKLFELGYSGNEGTGFGLAIVAAIVEAHGWTIDVTERKGNGARFEIHNMQLLGAQSSPQ